MNRFLRGVLTLCGLCLFYGCGGGSGTSTTSPPPPATHFSVTAPANATAGTAFNVTVTALDASNNVVASYAGTVHFTSSDSQAVLPVNSLLTNGVGNFSATLKTTGGQTITATDTVTVSITGTSNSISVSGATHFSVTAPANATAGTAFNVTVTALDASNNVATGYSGTVHFTSSDSHADLPTNSNLTNGTASLSAGLRTVGAQTITATDTAITTITGTSNSITVSPATAANPVPFINEPLSPGAVVPGGTALTLTVNGTGFVPGSKVMWNGSARATTFVSASKLTATVLAGDVASFNTASVTVANPVPGGGTSNAVFFETTRPTSSVAISTSSQLASGAGAVGAAVGDFNGDGKMDLAVTNAGSNNLSVFLGKGDGTFQTAANYAVGTAPFFVAVGDFNGDGKMDLAVANANSNNVSVLLGNGDGTFQTAMSYGVGTEPEALAAADLNGDGKLDLAVANSASSSISVLLGNGDGTFQTALTAGVGFSPMSIGVGDFDGDGILDLAVVTFGAGLNVLLGNGDGTFQPPVPYPAGAVPVAVAVGDFNADGILDLAVDNIGAGNTGPSSVDVLLGIGNGTFQPAVEYAAGSNTASSSMALGDFNGDGVLDLAVVNSSDGASGTGANILIGNSNGTFQPAMGYIAGAFPYSSAVGDFNGDGRLDMAVPDPASSTVSVMLQPPLVTGPNAVFSPTSLAFLTQLINTTSPEQSVLLSNYGTTTVDITNISASSNFGETENCGSSLAAGASCPINVTFTPAVSDGLSGTLSVADDAPGSPQTAALNGTGTVVGLNPASLRFGCVEVLGYHQELICMCTRAATVTLTNDGSAPLSITSITTAGPFSETNSCGGSVAAAQSCSVVVSWNHSSGNGSLSVSDNGGGSPQMVSMTGIAQCKP